jgi:hypothetical protein
MSRFCGSVKMHNFPTYVLCLVGMCVIPTVIDILILETCGAASTTLTNEQLASQRGRAQFTISPITFSVLQ